MADVFILYDDVQFDSGGWRNRNRVLQNGTPLWLTVPVLRTKLFGQLVKDVEIADSHWQAKHLKTLRQLYSSAPFFDWCYPLLDDYLAKRNYRWLVDLNVAGHVFLAEILGINWNVRFSSTLGHGGTGRTARLVALCSSVAATRYISSDASATYMEEHLWREAGIELVYQNYPHPAYRQSSHPFVGYLSTVDALMFVGPEAKAFVGISHSKYIDSPEPSAHVPDCTGSCVIVTSHKSRR